MALQEEHGTKIVKDYFQDKEGIPQEQTPSSFKSGEEMPIERVGGLYKVKGVQIVSMQKELTESIFI